MVPDFGKSFTFMFEDPQALAKLGIGALVGLGSIVLLPTIVGTLVLTCVLMGYWLEVTYNTMHDELYPLPTWDAWTRFLARGIKLFVVLLVWSLPALVLLVPALMAWMVPASRAGTHVWAVLMLGSGCCMGLLWSLFLAFMLPGIWVQVARTDSLSAGFEFGAIWSFTRANMSAVIPAVLLTWVAWLIALVAAPLGLPFFGIGALITGLVASTWYRLTQAHLYGQVGRADLRRLDIPAILP